MLRSFNFGSIGVKIFGAFFAMSVLIGALGVTSYVILSATGRITIDTYDKPLMAINFARAASVDFARMQNQALRLKMAKPEERRAIDDRINDLTRTFYDDLAVAEERTTQADEHRVIHEIEKLVNEWDAEHQRGLYGKRDATNFEKLNDRILERFDTLVELKAGSSFVERRKAIWTIYRFEYVGIAATATALLLALALTLFLARSIVRPLQAAARVADRIADGDMETEIPEGRKDETGTLLKSMRVMQASIREMMAREKAQRRSAETRLYDALESAQEGMMLVDEQGRIVVSNTRLGDFFPELAYALRAGQSFEIVFALLRTQLRAQEGVSFPAFGDMQDSVELGDWMVESQLKDGRWVRIQASSTSDRGIILFFSDFTDLKEREERYRIARDEAEVASAAKSAFLAAMGHELRTPLNAIIGFSEIISSQVFGAIGNVRYSEYANDILESGRRLLGVINNVLDIASSESGGMEAKMERLDLGDVLGDCIDRLYADCKAADLKLQVGDIDSDIFVSGDAEKLRKVFLNLFSNATKFTPAGGEISLAMECDESDSVRVVLRDTGIGMSEEEVDVALTPFGQADARLERRFEGAGLGLPLVEAYLKLHGATMAIDSAPDEGTTVTLVFPREGVARISKNKKGRMAV